MPIQYNDALDDRLIYDACMAFTGGQVSNVRSNLLGETQFAEGVNVDIDRFGSVVTRRGSEEQLGTVPPPTEDDWEAITTNWEDYGTLWENSAGPIRGLGYFDITGQEEMLCVADGILYKSSGSTWSSVSGYSPTSSNAVEFAQLSGKIFMSDGSNNVHSYNGTTVTDEGNTSSDPPVCKYLVAHTNRLFAAGTSTNDELAASGVTDGTSWSSADSIQIGADGDPITGIAPWYGHNLLVFKERSIFNVVADPSETDMANWVVQNVDRRIGCVSHRSIAQVGSDVFFLARDGIRTVRTILEGAQTAVSEPISIGIQDVIDDINWSYALEKAAGTFWNNHYILSIPTGSSAVNNTVVAYSTVSKSFVGKWTGWNANDFEVSAFSGFTKLNFGSSTGKVLTWLDYVAESSETDSTYQDAGADYESSVTSRGLVFGERFNRLQPRHVEVEFKAARSSSVEVRPVSDLELGRKLNSSDINTNTSSVTLPVTLPFTLPIEKPVIKSYNLLTRGPCREIQFRVKTSANKMHLRSLRASAYVRSMELETA